jgi:hypothetical protein
MVIVEQIRRKFNALAPVLNERGQRPWAAAEGERRPRRTPR